MTILRDPLQEQRTPYELLGVSREAADREIKNAFKMAFARRKENPRQLQQANKDLLNPQERILIDVALYDETTVRQLSPGLGNGRESLDFAQRPATAEAWRTQLNRNFPNLGLIHSLGVLWFWAAVHSGDHTADLAEKLQAMGKPADKLTTRATLLRRHSREAGVSPCNPTKGPACSVEDCPTRQACMHGEVEVADAWQRAIAYWAALLATDTFWAEAAGRVGADSAETQKAMEKSFHDHLFRQIDRFQSAGASGYAEQLQQLSGDLAVELKTARQMAEFDGDLLGTADGHVGAGRLLLQEVGQLTAVRQRVERRAKAAPRNKALQRLLVSLSPFGNVDEAVRRERWDEAQRQIESLSEAERRSAEGRQMEARVLVGAGRQEATLGNPKNARKHWTDALDVANNVSLRNEVKSSVEQACLERAAALTKGNPQAAMELLELGLELTGGDSIGMRMGEILATEAIKTFNDVQRDIKKREGSASAEDVRALEEALAKLERAAKMGSEKAAAQLQTARETLEGIGELQWVDTINSAVATFNRVQEAIKSRGGEVTSSDVSSLERAVRDLDKAAKGGSQRAAEQLQAGRRVLAEIKKASEQGAFAQEMAQANAAAGRGDWDAAIRYLRRALNKASGSARTQIKKNLATSLTNRAVGKVNDALGQMQRSGGFDARCRAWRWSKPTTT